MPVCAMSEQLGLAALLSACLSVVSEFKMLHLSLSNLQCGWSYSELPCLDYSGISRDVFPNCQSSANPRAGKP